MSRKTIAFLSVVVTVAVAGALVLLVESDDLPLGVPGIVPAQTDTVTPTAQPIMAVDVAPVPSQEVLSVDRNVAIAGNLAQAPTPLTVNVIHARGDPASGGRVALYDQARDLVGQGVLDGAGRWTHEGVDGPSELFVLGLNVKHAALELNPGRGEHELVLPAGAWLEGQLLVNGSPPGRPFPLGLDAVRSEATLYGQRDERPKKASLEHEVLSSWGIDGGFFTDASGHFMVSGLEAGSEVRLEWPRLYEFDEPYSSERLLTVPASGIVLSLKRPFLVRGRVRWPDGLPASDALLSMELRFSRQATTGASSISLTQRDVAVAADGRFAIQIGNPFRPKARPGNIKDPILVTLDVRAATPDGSWAQAGLSNGVITKDHALGELVLQPAQVATLAIVDPQGEPVVSANVRPESDRGSPVTLQTDEAGHVEIDLAAATQGLVTIVAPGFHTELVTLPTVAPQEPLVVVLTTGCAVTLRLLGPWDDEATAVTDWRYELSVSAEDSAYHDALLATDDKRQGPDVLRGIPEGFAGTSSVTNAGNDVEWGWTMGLPELHFEGLRANHPMRFRVRINQAPESFGEPPQGIVWESDEIWLSPGEHREVIANLTSLQPQR